MNTKINFHLFFLFILSLFYLLPFIVFGELIIQHPLDRFDNEIVFNGMIGRIFKGEFEAAKLMFNGNYEALFFTRIFHPLIILFAILDLNYAYWTYDILVQIISYITFFIFAKKISKDYFILTLSSSLFVSLSTVYSPVMLASIFGLGVAAIPYLIYLNIKNKNLKLKHYLILFFFGLNTHFYEILVIPVVLLLVFFFNKKINIKKFIKIFSTFVFSIFISNSNLFFILFSDFEFQRKIITYPLDLENNFINFIKRIFYLHHLVVNPFKIWIKPLVELFPYIILNFSIFIYLIFTRRKDVFIIYSIIIFIAFLCFLERTFFFNNLIKHFDNLNLLNTVNLHRVYKYIPIMYVVIFLYINSNKKNLILCFVGIFSLLYFQIRPLIYPVFYSLLDWENLNIEKKLILKENFYRKNFLISFNQFRDLINTKNLSDKNITKKYVLSFNNYYNFNEFEKLKKIINNDRVLFLVDPNLKTVLGYNDPMIMVANNINIMGGLAQFYSKEYHKKFREIISQELDINESIREAFDKTGYRAYAYVNDFNNVKIDFLKAKSLGAKYVFSRKKIANSSLQIICEACENNKYLNLYIIK